MLRIYKLMAILTLLLMAVLISGCYTVVGHPSPVEEGIAKEGTTEGQPRRHYFESEYEYDYPYYGGYYGLDPYYGSWYPGSYYYGGYYGGYSRWYNGYSYYPRYYYDDDHYYIPENRPETRRRGASELRRSPGPEDRREIEMERKEEDKQPERRIPERRGVEKRTQKAPERRRDTSSEKRRSSKQEAEDKE
ncbi:hypothetical protein ACFL6S_01575 [Candidatus Poribacteria bacterium]